MMKFWLIVYLINPNLPPDENYLGKYGAAYPSKTACEQALRNKHYMQEFVIKGIHAVEDPNLKPDCYSDNHVRGIKPDPGKRLD